MATIRRLSDADVRAIFESLHGNLPPPTHLRFKIVPVGPNGQKWSPPPYEFEGTIQWSSSPDRIPFKPNPLPILTLRWPLRLTEARKETKEFEGVSFHSLGSLENSTSFEASCHDRISFRHMPLESQWTSIPSTYGHSTTILLPKGRSRL
jgi:hypothetical protein